MMYFRQSLRRIAVALAWIVSSSACSRGSEAPQVPSAASSETTPKEHVRCIPPEPDSARAVAAAIQAVSGPLPLRVGSFVRHSDGALVSLVPASPGVAGGGGLVWVDRDGCVTLIKLSE